MFLGEPQPSQYDWRFQVFGFPTRVTWLFWAVSAALGYSLAQGTQFAFAGKGINVPLAALLAIWVGVTFVSILVHELGHALAFRYFGIQCEIVLYQMGGLAIPGAGMLWRNMGQKRRLSHVDQIIISAAGPGIQLLLAGIVGVVAVLCGIYVQEFAWLAGYLNIPLSTPKNPLVFAFVRYTLFINIWWALINLVPIYPLDGGQITQHVIGIIRRNSGLIEAYMIGAVVGALVAFWFYQRGSFFNAIFFASMAISNFQALQASGGPRSW
jgi:stage IV sporulation protein FB